MAEVEPQASTTKSSVPHDFKQRQYHDVSTHEISDRLMLRQRQTLQLEDINH